MIENWANLTTIVRITTGQIYKETWQKMGKNLLCQLLCTRYCVLRGGSGMLFYSPFPLDSDDVPSLGGCCGRGEGLDPP